MENLPIHIDPEDLSRFGAFITKSGSSKVLLDIFKKVLGEQATMLLFRKKAVLEVEKARMLASVDYEKMAVSSFSQTEEGKHVMNAIGASVLYQQLGKITNIANIVETSFDQIEQGRKPISEEPIDEDWMTSFFNYASTVSSDEVQKLWGRVLAGEITDPGSFSIRTLDFLKNITKTDAEIITDMLKLSVFVDGMSVIPGRSTEIININNRQSISLKDLQYLDELGVLRLATIEMNFVVINTANQTYIAFKQGRYIIYFNVVTQMTSIKIPIIWLSEIANQLSQLIDIEINIDVLRIIRKYIVQQIGAENPIVCRYVDSATTDTARRYNRGRTIIIHLPFDLEGQEIDLD